MKTNAVNTSEKSNIMCSGPSDWKIPDSKENHRTNVTSSQYSVVGRPRRTCDDSFNNNYTIADD